MAYDPYETVFRSRSRVDHYEKVVFAPNSYASVLTEIEIRFLTRVIQSQSAPRSYLDFACGTGRIFARIEGLFPEAVGLDISDEMLSVARAKCPEREYVCGDLLDPHLLGDRAFDFVSAFRFFLNLEPELREPYLSRLSDMLRNRESRLAVGFQGMTDSYRALPWLAGRIASALSGARPRVGTLTHFGFTKLVDNCGLKIDEVYCFDILSSRSVRLLNLSMVDAIERGAAGSTFSRFWGGHRIYVLRRA
jgi:SAM-dependent methyltransferase